MRLFVSVDCPDELAEPVADLQAEFADASGLDFTDPEQAHVTLKFLGEVPEDRLAAVTDLLEGAVAEADQPPFAATLGGLGVFPSLDYVSVLWLGVREGRGAADLTSLHEACEAAFVDAGFEAEDHDFTPHVTLARMRHAGGKDLVRRLVRERDPTVGTMDVERVCLTESTLTDDGPEYSTVHAVSL